MEELDAQAFERIVIALHTAAADSADRVRTRACVPGAALASSGTCVLDGL